MAGTLIRQFQAEQVMCEMCSRSVIGICPLRGHEPENPEKTTCPTVKKLRGLNSPGTVTARFKMGRLSSKRTDDLIELSDAESVLCEACPVDTTRCSFTTDNRKSQCPIISRVRKLKTYELKGDGT